jgi:flagellar hook assembly protein FlgD
MNYVKTIIQNVPRNRTIEGVPEFWDGRDDNGNLLPNGVYFYRVDIGDEEPLFGKIIYMQ